MTVRLVNAGNSALRTPEIPGPIYDLILLFGGWGVLDNAEPLSTTGDDGTSQLYRSVNDLPVPPGGRQRKILALSGSLSSNAGVEQGIKFIRTNFHPASKLIVYGYSAGGTDALELCRQISSTLGYYRFSTRTFATVFQMEGRMNTEVFGKVLVDLLITVDGASGPASGALNRGVASCVVRNVNFYQGSRSRIGSRGGPNVATAPWGTQVENTEVPGESHSTIDEATNPRALQAIRGALGYEAVPPNVPSNAG